MITRRSFIGGIIGGVATFFGIEGYLKVKDETIAELLAEMYGRCGGDEIPTSDYIRWLTKVPANPERYITPDDPVVQEYARKIDIDIISEGRFGYFITPPELKFEYETDSEQFGKGDEWQMPRDYLLSGGVGDCEDYTLAIASIFEAKNFPARVVCGVVRGRKNDPDKPHAVVETVIDDYEYIMDVSWPRTILSEDKYRRRVYKWKPLAMFGKNMSYRLYHSSWDL